MLVLFLIEGFIITLPGNVTALSSVISPVSSSLTLETSQRRIVSLLTYVRHSIYGHFRSQTSLNTRFPGTPSYTARQRSCALPFTPQSVCVCVEMKVCQ